MALDEMDLRDNTIVIFTSDNGPVTSDWYAWYEVNAHGSTGGLRGRKHRLYEGGIKVPAIVRYPPAIVANSSSDTLITGLDWFVTLNLLAGAKVPKDRLIDGENIWAALRGNKIKGQRTLHWALDGPDNITYAVREGNWKLLIDRHDRVQGLYDLSEDPLELINRIEDQPDRTQRLNDLKESFYSDLNAVYLNPN